MKSPKCKDCGTPTNSGTGSARCKSCWEDRCEFSGHYNVPKPSKKSTEPTPYLIAQIAFDPASKYPWYVTRTGLVGEQGGPGFGTESMWYETLAVATNDLEQLIMRDLELVKEKITTKERIKKLGKQK
jgi:hypothetical protein